jgi:hypothetical protein
MAPNRYDRAVARQISKNASLSTPRPSITPPATLRTSNSVPLASNTHARMPDGPSITVSVAGASRSNQSIPFRQMHPRRVMEKGIPGGPIGAAVFAHGTLLPLAQVRTAPLPRTGTHGARGKPVLFGEARLQRQVTGLHQFGSSPMEKFGEWFGFIYSESHSVFSHHS